MENIGWFIIAFIIFIIKREDGFNIMLRHARKEI